MSKDDLIDLTKLNQRDLIIRLNDRMRELAKDFDELKGDLKSNDAKYVELLVKVSALETKVLMWGVISGGIASAIIAISFEFIIK